MKRWTGNPWRRLGLPSRLGWLVLGFYGTAMLLILADWVAGWQSPHGQRPLYQAVSLPALVFAAACAGYAAYHATGRHRLGWLALVPAMLGAAVGQIIWAVYDVRPEVEHASHPAVGEVFFSLYPLGAMAALVLISRASRSTPRRLVLDGLIVAASLFVICWVFVLDKQLREDAGSMPVTLGEVTADIILATTAIIMLSRAHATDWPSRRLVAVGIAVISIADMLVVFRAGFGSYHDSDPADVFRLAGIGMIALGALASVTESPTRPSRTDEILSRTRLWLPYLPLLVAAAVGLSHAVGLMAHGPMLAALGLLAAAVLARQFLVLLENRKLLSEVAREAFRDSLTGLANRAFFLHRLEESVARLQHDTNSFALLCLDLDNFKQVNDALGHPAGDELLVRVAGRLTAVLDGRDTIARLRGDEFAVLLRGSVDEAHAAAHRVLDAFNTAIVIEGVPVAVRPSIGFTVATPASNCTVDQLLRHADLAMYTAKREGGQCVRSFIPDLPLRYSLPEDADSTALAGEGWPPGAAASAYQAVTGTRGSTGAFGNGTAVAPALRPVAGPATSAHDQPRRAADGIRWPPTGIRIVLALLAFGVLVFAVTSIADPKASHGVLFADCLYAALNALAAALIALRAIRVAADRLAWSLIAAGMGLSALGDIVYAAWVTEGQSPSPADPEYLAFYPFVYAGLILLTRARLRRVPVALQLDSLVCGLAVAGVGAALASGPIRAAAARAPATVLVGLAYPAGDLLLLALAAGVLPIVGWRNGFRWLMLALGFIGFAIADTVYLFQTSAGSYRVGTTLDVLWPASSLLVAVACWTPWSSAAPLPRRGLSSYTVPVACTAIAVAVAVLGHRSGLASTLAALSLVAVAARFSVTFRDVGMLAESHRHAMTDDLTALPNRRSLATALTELRRPDSAGSVALNSRVSRRALILLHLCDFEEVTESIGRHFADELVCRVANRLAGTLRREGLLARVRDDEFAVLLDEGSDLITARTQAGRLLEALSEPFQLDPVTMGVDACVAIALYPDHCEHPQELLTRAETAVRHAKSTSGKIAVYDPAFEMYRDNDPRLVEELRAALVEGGVDQGLTLHYQPKINAADGSVHSVEALLRWHHPTRGLLLPEEFLPAAERAGLNRRIANRTIESALAQVRCWSERGMLLPVAVNLSTTNLLDLELVGTIDRLLKAYGLPPNALIMEITESALVDSARSRNTVTALQHLGVRISLDDYGTGWSSLARLQDVSVDELKMDRIFVSRLVQDPRSVAIVRSTVALARSLGADLVAEGAEDEMTLNALHRYGCTITQGFIHTPPLPPEELWQWITTHAAQPKAGQPQQAGARE